MESMKKEEAALKAAAKYHDYLAKAVLEYMELTKQIDDDLRRQIHESCEECLSPYNGEIDCEYMKQQGGCFLPDSVENCSSFRAAQEEMLSLLDGYRHPAKDSLTENRIFFGEQVNDMRIKFPVWMNDRDFLKLPSELSGKIRDYIRDAEISKWTLTRECNDFRGKFIAAREAYKKINDKDKSHQRNTRVVQALGLSSGQGKTKSLEHRQAYIRYVRLVRNEGKSRKEALDVVRKEFDYNSPDAAIKSLYVELKKVKEWWRKPTAWCQKPITIEKYWASLILSKPF
uniref:hypothetical protein n=1 Tax=Candidatus Electronema sp. TaxID=2698783 RepID=UPI004057B1A2